MTLFVFSYVDIPGSDVGMEQVFAFIVVDLNETYMDAVDDMGRLVDCRRGVRKKKGYVR